MRREERPRHTSLVLNVHPHVEHVTRVKHLVVNALVLESFR